MAQTRIPMRFDYLRRLFYFLIISLVCLLFAGVVMGVIIGTGDTPTVRQLRLATIVQDVVAFILPALVTAIIVTPLPASMLGVDRMFRLSQLLMAVGVMIASIPVMNILIDWNAHITLPESMSGIEEYLRRAEQQAAGTVEKMLGGEGAAQLVVSVLIVGVLAGLSEELFFRGVLQRLIGSGPLGIHATIWITAIIFSLFHMQFYGFFPRVLLGAFFGYLLWWSGSIWLPVIIHALNNTVYVVTYRNPEINTDTFGLGDIWLGLASVICTATLIMWLVKSRSQR